MTTSATELIVASRTPSCPDTRAVCSSINWSLLRPQPTSRTAAAFIPDFDVNRCRCDTNSGDRSPRDGVTGHCCARVTRAWSGATWADRPVSELEGGDDGGVVGAWFVAMVGGLVVHGGQRLGGAHRVDLGESGGVDEAVAGEDWSISSPRPR